MATKSTKSVGNGYWINAAKQFEWPIDFEDKVILVPESELSLAEDNLMVAHFRNNGWHIQLSIDVIKTKPFVAPVSGGRPIFKTANKVVAEVEQSQYTVGNTFRVLSTGCELQIMNLEKGKVHLKYTNRDKHNLLLSEDGLTNVLHRQLWEAIL